MSISKNAFIFILLSNKVKNGDKIVKKNELDDKK